MTPALVLVPAVAGIMSFSWRGDYARRALLLAAAILHAVLTVLSWRVAAPPGPDAWLGLDSLGLYFLSVVSGLFLVASFYAVGYFQRERARKVEGTLQAGVFVGDPEAVFTGCWLLFLAAMTLVTMSQHFGLLWVTIEATTLASAPLIYFHRDHFSLEATWKYLLLCSVGIALALLGTFLLAAAMPDGADGEPFPFVVTNLVENERSKSQRGSTSDVQGAAGQTQRDAPSADRLKPAWLKMAFILMLVGYGTKMGLAPMHNWKPDVYSECPAVVGALLSGALSTCAFLGILRVQELCVAAGEYDFTRPLLIGFGLCSMGVAAVFVWGQADFKRMLAYSSIEHVGILSLGVGLGAAGAFGAMFHALHHALLKGALFFAAGNITAAFASKSVSQVRGAARVLPVTGVLWLGGMLAITGAPPFGMFISELAILRAAIASPFAWVAIAYLALLSLIFIGMANVMAPMTQGDPLGQFPSKGTPEPLWSILPPMVLAGLSAFLCLYVPPGLSELLTRIAQRLGV